VRAKEFSLPKGQWWRLGRSAHNGTPAISYGIDHAVLFGAGLSRSELTGLDLAQLQPGTPAELRRVKKARLTGLRGKGRTQRTVFLGLDARAALADYLEHERPADVGENSAALFLAAASIAPGGPAGGARP
jgi:site-specific recombinase XerC